VELFFVLERNGMYEHHLEMNDEGVESLWVRIKGQDNMGDIIMSVCYQPPHQEVEADEAFYRQLEVASRSQASVLMGGLQSAWYLIEKQHCQAHAIKELLAVLKR